MRINELNEGVAGTLYHVMDMKKAENVFMEDRLDARWTHTIGDDDDVVGTSFSRNKRFWFGEQYVVKIAVDITKVKARTRIYPVDADRVFAKRLADRYGKHVPDDAKDRMGARIYHSGEFAEEFVAGDLAPLHTYLESIEIRNILGISWNMVYCVRAYAEKYNIKLTIDPRIVRQLHDRELAAAQDDEPYSDPMFFKGFDELTESASLRPAIRHGGKVYSGKDHFDALDKIKDDRERSKATLDGNSRGFMNERGRFLDRYKAAEYARNFDLYDKSHPDWRYWMDESPDLISEIPLKEGYRLPLATGTIPRARGSYGAFITTMHASDFLRLTTLHDDHIREIKDRAFPQTKDQYTKDMGREEGFGKFWMPYLNVAFPSGKVLGHEGRHRSAMVLAHGGDLIPVIIYPKTDEEYLAKVRYWSPDGGSKTLVTDDTYSTREEARARIESKIAELGIDEDDVRDISVDFVGHSTLKGEPTRSEGWDRAKWLTSDFPDQLVGQFNPAVVVPRNHIKIGLVKGYRSFTR